VNSDAELAYRTILQDDEVDQLKDQVFRELLTFMMSDPTTIRGQWSYPRLAATWSGSGTTPQHLPRNHLHGQGEGRPAPGAAGLAEPRNRERHASPPSVQGRRGPLYGCLSHSGLQLVAPAR